MMNDGNGTILWLDDQLESIRFLTEYLENEGFNISAYESDDEALQALVEREPEPDVFVVDLMLKPDGEDGLSVAKTAKVIRPTMQVVAVTEHLMEYSPDIAFSLVQRDYPFSGIWVKGDLESLERKKQFATELRLLCEREPHRDRVIAGSNSTREETSM